MPQSALLAPVLADDRAAPRLSTDYLNRFGEALMLIESVPVDEGVIDDLKAWRPMGYVEHFEVSALRCAPSAIAAYRNLDPKRRVAFDSVCRAMARLVSTATILIEERSGSLDQTLIVDVTAEALRKLMARASRFINANGATEIAMVSDADLQGTIDTLFA